MISAKKIFFFLFLLPLAFTAFGQDIINVHLQVKDSGNPVGLAYVSVYAGSSGQLQTTAMTDEQGNVSVNVAGYPCTIEVVAIGYEMERITLQKKPEKDLSLNITKNFSALNEVVITGVSRPTKPQNALSVYKVITAATMQAQGAVNLQDAMGYQLNTTVTTDNVLGSKTRMQGMSGNNVKILMDGMPLNGREGGNIDMGQLNTYNAEKIEIIQGPMSVIYGTDALGGVINIITKNNRKPFELNANAYYETVGKYNFNLSASRSWKRHSFTLGGGRNFFEGWKYLDTARYYNSDTVLPQRHLLFKPKEQYMGNFNYSYVAPSGFSVRLASDFVRENITDKGLMQAFDPNRANAQDDYYRNTRSVNRLLLSGKLGKDGHWQMMNGYALYHRTKNKYNVDLTTLEKDLSATDNDTTTFNDFSFRGSYDNNLKFLEYAVGYDVNLENGKSLKIPGQQKNIGDYAGYLTVSVPIFKDKLILQSGWRATYNTSYKSPVIPSFNLLYHAGRNINLRASYARGFRAPTLKELYLDFVDLNHKIEGNPDLKAEVGDHYQASASWLVFEKKANYAQVLITGFYNDAYNQISLSKYPDNDPTHYIYTNIDRLRNIIANVELEGQYSNFYYKLGYAYRYTYAQQGQYDAFQVSEFTGTLQYYWKKVKLNFSLFNKLTGAQPALVDDITGNTSYSGRQPAYNMMDCSIGRKLWSQKVQITAGVKNILNVQTVSAPGVAASSSAHGSNSAASTFLPRSFFTSVSVKLD